MATMSPNKFDLMQMLDKQFSPMAKRLFNESADVMTRYGRESQHPADIIVAALEDERIRPFILRIVSGFGLTLDDARRLAQRVENRPDFKGRGVMHAFMPEMDETLERLYVARDEHLSGAASALRIEPNHSTSTPTKAEWDWVVELVRASLQVALKPRE